MRILVYVPYYVPASRQGGPVRSVHGLARALVQAGHEVTVLTTNVDGDEILDVPLDRPVEVDGVSVYYFAIQTPRRLYYSPAMAQRAETLLQRSDVLYLNGVFLWPGPRLGRAARRAGVPVVLAPRGMLMPDLMAGKSLWIKRAWISLQERANLAGASALHVTATAEGQGLQELGLDLAPVHLIPNGVDIPPIPPAVAIKNAWGDVPVGNRVVYLGRLGWNKGVDMAIEATRAHPTAIIRLAGHDEIGLRAQLEPRLTRPDGRSLGAFQGQLDGVEKWALVAGADVMLVPSLQENFGNVVAEAMAVGTPVIATEGVGAATYLARIDPGLRIPRDQDRLNRHLAELLSDAPRRARIATGGKALIAAELDWQSIAATAAKLFASLIGGGRP